MRLLEVGKVFDKNMPYFHGVQLGLFEGGLGLFISIPNCPKAVIEDVNKGECELALTIKDGLMFFMFAFKSLGWYPTPFSIRMFDNLKDVSIDIENFDYNKIVVFLVDPNDKILKALCIIMPSKEFGIALKKEFKRQEKGEPFNAPKMNKKLQETLSKYSMQDLLKASNIVSNCSSVSTESIICQNDNGFGFIGNKND